LSQAPPAWTAHLASLREDQPLAGLRPDRRGTYCADAAWLIARHGAELAAAGSSMADIFEIIPGKRDCGGLVELLDGARGVTIEGRTARFVRSGVAFRFEAQGGQAGETGWLGHAPWQPLPALDADCRAALADIEARGKRARRARRAWRRR
jgi:hypothetical protein